MVILRIVAVVYWLVALAVIGISIYSMLGYPEGGGPSGAEDWFYYIGFMGPQMIAALGIGIVIEVLLVNAGRLARIKREMAEQTTSSQKLSTTDSQ